MPKGTRLESAYRRALRTALRRPALVIAGASAVAVFGAMLVASRPVAFMPSDAATELAVSVEFPAGTDLDGLAGRAKDLSAALSGVPGVAGAYGSAGSESDDVARRADPAYSREILTIVCPLKAGADIASTKSALLETAQASVGRDIKVMVRVPEDPAAKLLGLDGGAVIAARGDTREEAISKADEISSAIALEAGTALDVITRSPSGTRPRILLTPDREAAAALGVSLADAAQGVRAATEGVTAAMLETAGRETKVRVFAVGAGAADGSGSMLEAAAVPVSVSGSAPVGAYAVARFTRTNEEAAVARLDRADVVYLEPKAAPGRDRDLAAATERVLSRTKGAARADDSAFRTYGAAMFWAVILVLVLLYLTLGAQFESFSLPVVIMATIPLAMAGAGPALVMAGIGLDSGSILGLVVLFGVVVNNAILLYETSAARKASGAGDAVAAYAGASERVRPVLATTMTTVVALLPICLSPTGAAQRSMSVAMLGGLIASTALTLFVSPIAFARKKK